jgi:serine/threonine protein kinase
LKDKKSRSERPPGDVVIAVMSSTNAKHRIIRNDYKVIKTIGRGNFGVVHLTECLRDGRKYVIKQIPLNELSKSEQDGSLQEVKLLATLRHPFIVAYKESFLESVSC